MRITFIHALFFNLGLSMSLDSLSPRTKPDIGPFKNPELTAFLQIDLAVGRETNVTGPDTKWGAAPNVQGGRVSGAFEADILPLGTSYERYVKNEQGENSFYYNRYILKTADNETISLEVDAIVNYRNNALHGFGFGKFVTAVPHLLYLNYNVYLIEVTGDFETGKAASQLFALKSGGRRDGEPIRALLPIG
ncbi:hypothetical protein FGSG_03013 [Fusarium graminearum PH-1]|uniref:Chromosome 2, complete genome n=1 Tax=Gibberella zeae (strain ATCC MYA-4620 / CBS 123657 / FGSC 9075 / NRRL 31084 / PH-1) TaxID=229533 RepID=I1RGY1_GIBZE|nr:hypothetical protein FGSG_03013 [Fusarium graminearum PH-1]ESU10276.1 hypothetical protein FGSG_03013 [Fusarium graminearum PH-1]CEF77727.1 unnamed protein product [Fusarium graminearum]|eukprot:XP_011322775.1 hypothetical protein FGSG_03013 [Fusarium graminearum PH-1]